jgi:hypothetical protein
VTLAGTDPNGAFGGWIDATDVNGDGISDLVVTASCAPYDTTAQACGGGRMYVFTGGATGLSTTPLSTVSFVNYLQFHQGILAAVGDTNGDGFGDMARGVGSDSNSQTSPLEIWYGSASGFTTANMTTLSVGYVGDALAGLDYNGDGYADVASSFHRFRGYTSGYTIYLGGPNGVTSASGGGGGTTTDFCCALAPAGDVNGDVIGDLNVAQILTLSVNASDSVLCGGGICGGSITSPSSNSPAGFGVGDMNGDGFEDELMTLTGAYSIYFGSPTFGATPLTPDVTLQ